MKKKTQVKPITSLTSNPEPFPIRRDITYHRVLSRLFPFSKMTDGDAFEIPVDLVKKCKASAKTFNKKNVGSKTVIVVQQHPDGFFAAHCLDHSKV